MSTQAVGEYLKVMREARQLSRVQVAALTGTNESQMIRIEKGEVDTRGSLLLAIAQAVGADLTDIQQLILDENADFEIGKQFATNRIANRLAFNPVSEKGVDELEQLLAKADAEERVGILNEILEFARFKLLSRRRAHQQEGLVE